MDFSLKWAQNPNKGKVKAHYFSHKGDHSCSAAYETQLHLTAKEYFSRTLEIPHPQDRNWSRAEACPLVSISNVRLEQTEDGKRPDLIVDIGQEKYWVEIANKHQCDSEKIEDVRQLSRNLIEIDVSDLSNATTFKSLSGCKVKIQSLHPMNDSHGAILLAAAEREKKTRERLRAVRKIEAAAIKRTKKLTGVERKTRKNTERAISNYQKQMDRINVTRTNEEKYLAELEGITQELKTQIDHLSNYKTTLEAETRAAEINKSEAIEYARAQLEAEAKEAIEERLSKIENNWKVERANRFSELNEEIARARKREEKVLEDRRKRLEEQINKEAEAALSTRLKSARDSAIKSIKESERHVKENRSQWLETSKKRKDEETTLQAAKEELLSVKGKIHAAKEDHKTAMEQAKVALDSSMVRAKRELEADIFQLKKEKGEAISEILRTEKEVRVCKAELEDIIKRSVSVKRLRATRNMVIKELHDLQGHVNDISKYGDFAIKKASYFAVEFKALRLAIKKAGGDVADLDKFLDLPEFPSLIAENIRKSKLLHAGSLAELYRHETGEEIKL